MRIRSLAIGISAAFTGICIATAPLTRAEPAPAEASADARRLPCVVAPDYGPISITGVLTNGCFDCWGDYRVVSDLGARSWDIARDCSIDADWDALVGKRVHVEGTAVLVQGGIGGNFGAALGVARVEVVTPTLPISWGRIRWLYK